MYCFVYEHNFTFHTVCFQSDPVSWRQQSLGTADTYYGLWFIKFIRLALMLLYTIHVVLKICLSRYLGMFILLM